MLTDRLTTNQVKFPMGELNGRALHFIKRDKVALALALALALTQLTYILSSATDHSITPRNNNQSTYQHPLQQTTPSIKAEPISVRPPPSSTKILRGGGNKSHEWTNTPTYKYITL